MSATSLFRIVRLLFAGAAALSWCAGSAGASSEQSRSSTSAGPQADSRGSFMSAGIFQHRPLLYMSYPEAGEVNIYPAERHNASPIGRIAGLAAPSGLAVDRAGNLWVYESTEVAAFHRGSTTAFISFPVPPGFAITVDRSGNVYVATTYRGILVYPNGATAPSRIVFDPFVALWASPSTTRATYSATGTFTSGTRGSRYITLLR
jgi:hypothetical protein